MTTCAAIFDRFASCMRDRPLLWAVAVFCRPKRSVVASWCRNLSRASAETHPAPSAVASDQSLRQAGAGAARSRVISDKISLNI